MNRWMAMAWLATGFLAAQADAAPPALPAAPAAARAAVGKPAPSARPAVAARPAEAYPPADLAKHCEDKAGKLRTEFGPKLRVVVHPPFLVAGDMPEKDLESYAKWSVLRPAKAMWASYFDKKPDQVITVMLFAGEENYKRFARRDYPQGGSPYFGYYTPDSRTMVMNIRTGTGTLVHELTHALIVYDFTGLPTWFNEGLASLHEQCNVEEDGIKGLTNWRLPALQAAIADKKLRPLAELLTERDFYGSQQGINYAQARYFVMYMQHKDVLGKFYRHFRDHHTGAGADVKAVEHVFGQKLPAIESAYLAWVKTLKFAS